MKLSDNALATILSGYSVTWQTINLRVGATLAAKKAGRNEELAGMLPHFPLMTQACEVWRSVTFPDLIAVCEDLSELALTMSINFGTLSAVLAEHRGAETLPPAARAQVRNTLQAMHAPTVVLAASMEGLLAQMTSFHAINEAIGDEIATQLAAALTLLSPTSVARLQAVGQSIGAGLDLACGVWRDMLDDLRGILSLSAELLYTPDGLTSLGLGDAIDFWSRTHNEVLAFSDTLREVEANGYCDDRAITGNIPVSGLFAAPPGSPVLLAEYLLLSCGLPPPRTASH